MSGTNYSLVGSKEVIQVLVRPKKGMGGTMQVSIYPTIPYGATMKMMS